MQATANPLRKPKPPRDRWLHHGRFYFTGENGKLESGLGTLVYLTAGDLWITPELSIPLGSIESMRIVRRRGLPPRRFLEIDYVNPITRAHEAVFLCSLDPFGIGLYRIGPVEDLLRRIRELHPQSGSSSLVGVKAAARLEEAPSLDRCEACGAKPATYVPYTFLVSAVLLSYRSEAKRRIHCRKHNAIHGLAYYLLTVLTGWIGIGIFAYPSIVFVAAQNLAPSLGKAWYALVGLPFVGGAALLAHLLL